MAKSSPPPPPRKLGAGNSLSSPWSSEARAGPRAAALPLGRGGLRSKPEWGCFCLSRQRIGCHLQMQMAPFPGMRLGHGLVQLHAEARLRWRDDISVLPFDLLLQKLGVEAVPGLDRFKDQEIRQRDGKLDVGRRHDRPAIAVRRHLNMLRLGHGGDLLGLQYAA